VPLNDSQVQATVGVYRYFMFVIIRMAHAIARGEDNTIPNFSDCDE
jgi:hypothetical protein